MKKISIDDVPTLARWTEVGVDENDNALNGHINTLRECISDLVAVEDDLAPTCGREPSEGYKAVNHSCRLMALILSDLKAIRREVHTARLLNDSEK